jgi:hypothetical protein
MAISQALDVELDRLAELRRPKQENRAIPAGWIRVQFEARGRKHFPGECVCKSYCAAVREN